MKRGVSRIGDLYARSEIRPGSQCWWWLGALSAGVSPRIWTFDHDRGEKAAMSGPRAVWNIANGCGLGERLAYMRCVNSRCVNPAHVGAAASKAEIGAHIARLGVRKGTYVEQRRANVLLAQLASGRVPTPPEIVLAVRAADQAETNTSVAARLGICHTTVSRIRRGESHRQLLEETTCETT